MTSRQPRTIPPGTTGGTGMLDDGSRPGGQRWPLQVLPLALLILLGLAGLRGVAPAPQWNGPLHRDYLAVGGALEVVLGILLVLTLRRRSAYRRQRAFAAAHRTSGRAGPVAPVNAVAVKLCAVLTFLLGAGMAAVVVLVLGASHLFTVKPRVLSPFGSFHKPNHHRVPRSNSRPFHIPVAPLLYTLLVVALVAAVAVSIWWSRRPRSHGAPRVDDFIAEDPAEPEDPEDLREAVESGRSALRTLDDARAAIIACYVAMETHLAERGTARGIAGTPDELLARATQTGLVRGTAAARLTALFYEARFSSHPVDRRRRDEAERALDELAAALDELRADAPTPGNARR
jgi:uncharacterized protein DUF4129